MGHGHVGYGNFVGGKPRRRGAPPGMFYIPSLEPPNISKISKKGLFPKVLGKKQTAYHFDW